MKAISLAVAAAALWSGSCPTPGGLCLAPAAGQCANLIVDAQPLVGGRDDLRELCDAETTALKRDVVADDALDAADACEEAIRDITQIAQSVYPAGQCEPGAASGRLLCSLQPAHNLVDWGVRLQA